jgi:VIT1/CCC1 family predicted Fe2+/Mn2+ transporter
MEHAALKKYLENWREERNSAFIYQALSEIEQDPRVAEVYRRMSAVEIRHAEQWAQKYHEGGGKLPAFQPALRTRLLLWLAKRLGPSAILPSLQAMEKDGTANYTRQVDANTMASEERTHSILLSQIKKSGTGGVEGGILAQLEGRHRSTGGNALRAAVLGANDGLVSNLSLVMGVAGASLDNRSILIAGFAGLLAGACSMALGEWLSVQSSRELFMHQIGIEEEEITQAPEEEAEELALIYEARGLDSGQARTLANQIMANKEKALETLAREELGVDPESLGGSAWEAAITSFLLFAIGAVIPVIPFTFMSNTTGIIASILLSTLGLFALGSAITLFTGRSVLFSGARMVIFGLAAAAITFGIGRLIGVSIGA